MSDETRYDEATVQLVADCIDLYTGMTISRTDPNMLADAALRTLANAGLLMPPGGVTREEWGTRLAFGYLMPGRQRTATSTHRRTVVVWQAAGEPNDNWPLYIGPWVEVTE